MKGVRIAVTTKHSKAKTHASKPRMATTIQSGSTLMAILNFQLVLTDASGACLKRHDASVEEAFS
jgi:hypothetical protein